MQMIAALLAGSMSSSFLNIAVGASIHREDAAVNDGGWPIFVRSPTNDDPGMGDEQLTTDKTKPPSWKMRAYGHCSAKKSPFQK